MKYYTMMHNKYFKYNLFHINIRTRFALGWELVGYLTTDKNEDVNLITVIMIACYELQIF